MVGAGLDSASSLVGLQPGERTTTRHLGSLPAIPRFRQLSHFCNPLTLGLVTHQLSVGHRGGMGISKFDWMQGFSGLLSLLSKLISLVDGDFLFSILLGCWEYVVPFLTGEIPIRILSILPQNSDFPLV